MGNLIRGVLYLERDKFQLSIDTREDIITYPFTPNYVSNLDIIDPDGLKQNLTDFLKQNNIVVSDIIIVVSSQCLFEKDFKKEEEPQIAEYIDNIPYETVSVKKIPIERGTKIIVGNATFFSLLADIFYQSGIKLSFVVPEIALGAPIGAFSASTARLISSRIETLSQLKFEISDMAEMKVIEEKVHVIKEKKKKSVMIILLPVIGIILIILIFIIVQPFIFKKQRVKKPRATPVNTSSPTLVPSPLLNNVATSSAKIRQPVSAQIVFDQSVATSAGQIRIALAQLGIANIQSVTSSTTLTDPILIFAQDIDPISKQKVLDEVKKLYSNVVTQETNVGSDVDISLTLGKATQ